MGVWAARKRISSLSAEFVSAGPQQPRDAYPMLYFIIMTCTPIPTQVQGLWQLIHCGNQWVRDEWKNVKTHQISKRKQRSPQQWILDEFTLYKENTYTPILYRGYDSQNLDWVTNVWHFLLSLFAFICFYFLFTCLFLKLFECFACLMSVHHVPVEARRGYQMSCEPSYEYQE